MQEYISQKAPAANAQVYQKQLSAANNASEEVYDTKNSQVLQKEETTTGQEKKQVSLDGLWIGVAVLVALVGLVVFVRRRRK